MDKVNLSAAWEQAVEKLLTLPKEKRQHFSMLVVSLAECYTQEQTNRAVVLIDTEDNLAMFSAGADEYTAYDIIERAYQLMQTVCTDDAPAREMFN